MSILKELSLKDKLWRQIAYSICKDKQLADDLVQTAYLKLMNRLECTEPYFRTTLKNLFNDYIKRQNRYNDNIQELSYEDDTHQLTDYECRVINRFYKLDPLTQELIKKKAELSFRQISEDIGVYPMKIYREIKEAKDKIIKE